MPVESPQHGATESDRRHPIAWVDTRPVEEPWNWLRIFFVCMPVLIGFTAILLVLHYFSKDSKDEIITDIVFAVAGITWLCLFALLRLIRQVKDPSRAMFGVTGPGFVQDHRGRIWTADSSVADIRPERNLIFMKSMIVEIVGQAGLLRMSFSKVDDPSFAIFWQNWRHPNPRLVPATGADSVSALPQILPN